MTRPEREGSYRKALTVAVGVALARHSRMEKMMPTDIASGPKCTLETRPEIWDLSGSMTAIFADKANPTVPIRFLDAGHDLLVTVTVTLTGRIVRYLCNTTLCVGLAFQACGCGPSGDYCVPICLEGDHCPCKTDTWEFPFDIKGSTFNPGECGREYELCITLGSKDCCGRVGFVFGSCHEYTITVSPAQDVIRPLAG